MVVLGGGGISYERGTPVLHSHSSMLSVTWVCVAGDVGGAARLTSCRRLPTRTFNGPASHWYRGTSLVRKRPPPPGPAEGPRHSPTVGSYGEAFSYERGTPVHTRGGDLEQASALVPLQGYLAHKTPPPHDPAVGPWLGSYGRPRGWAFS